MSTMQRRFPPRERELCRLGATKGDNHTLILTGLKVKNPGAPVVAREGEDDWGQQWLPEILAWIFSVFQGRAYFQKVRPARG